MLSQSGSNAGVFKVGVMSDISDESTFELVKRITMNNYNEQEFFQISLANINLSGPNKYIVFKHEIINNSESFCMDNLIIEEIPNCNRVSGLKVLTATESTARIEWEVNASALSYEVALFSVNKGP